MMVGRTYSRAPWRLGEILIQQRMITWEELYETLDRQKQKKELLGQLLLQMKFITEDQLSKALAAQCGLDFVYLTQCAVESEALQAVPSSFVRQFQFMPLSLTDNYFLIAVSNPFNLFLSALLTQITGREEIRLIVAGPEDIRTCIHEYYDPPCLAAS